MPVPLDRSHQPAILPLGTSQASTRLTTLRVRLRPIAIDMTPPLQWGGSITDLSVTDGCPKWSDDGNSMPFRVPALPVNISH
jgi:hypothetical protein